ncbi:MULTISPECIES: acyclic terpene utilization AtuA family protein [Achromobacter]|uniref:Acyclic terpene utilization AtuA family protein n=1 Tax=Alcaligenes xylosoxydans xylosoxydans TaxID=85698 RepID=A0A424W5N8_ALCXX|nr:MULTISPECIES: acyclic terpene utilization AtuA family protein [Achromobacter]MBC9907815.1 acyclic terpene utilization AtuA family protein [Achromobacter xylosoxidans]MBD0872280.1 acyclic terpene utilization AtuA family protein [Achromobacter xylosoxidans]QNP84331.1 acyclic terpene utilization AtuA family protein [Achromobacter xylosoxidans]RPJ88616.1 acyclic terpene utilization AtuA family protein [Achromobacter xylosoxidans]WLW60271.1 acyclic terpene utilization AtuA family protein [Achrom
MRSMSIICPNGHLGFAPLRTESFQLGVAAGPDCIAADSGSDDVGPVPLGSDTSTSPQAWQRHDLEQMLLAARKLGVPMVIGSAGDTGSNSRVDLYVRLIKEIAAEHKLAPFKIGYFYSEVDKERVRRALRAGQQVAGLDGYADLTEAELDASDRIVAVAGVHPYIKLLEAGADVVIGGRSSDAAVFAAPALHQGYDADRAYYLGKVLECASFCAEPYGGKETVMGEISAEDVRVTAMHPDQRCTIASVAGHAMYERSNPYEEFFAGGRLDMAECRYEQLSEKTTRITGSRFEPAAQVRVKLEGSGKVGERYMGLCGIRDPYTIANVDRVIAWARDKVRERFGDSGYELHYKVYGRDGVMGDLEPLRDQPGHELCVMVQGVAPTAEMAEELTLTGLRQMFYARLPDVKGTAGSVSFPLDEVVRTSAAYRWTLNHTLPVEDAGELFPTHLTEAGA